MKKLLSLIVCALLLTSCAATYDGPTQEVPRLTEHLIRHHSPFSDGSVQENRMTYAYDIYGNRVQKMDYMEGELTCVVKLRYDDRGNEISSTYWDHTGWIPHVYRRVERTYDDQNRELTYTSYGSWGKVEGRSSYTYDDAAHTVTFENDSGDHVVYYYDENGLQLRDVAATLAGTYETVYEYDDRGNRIGFTETKDGVRFGRFEARYDDQNRQIWGARYDENDQLISQTTYVYDDEAHTMTYEKGDGGKRIEYYTPDGRPVLIEDYYEGELSMSQMYTYRDIRVPVKEEAP